jgi:copper homeostasis protein
MREQPVLEVIACTVADAVEAKHGGARRLEIVRNLELGGLTPSFDLVNEISAAVGLPLRVMVRESVGYGVSDAREIDNLCLAAKRLGELRVDGLVIGYLTNGVVDLALCKRILSSAPNLKATFHHAFEDTRDQLQALQDIKNLHQVDRILSHGGPGSLGEKIARFRKYQELASPKIKIIAGGGIDLDAISQIRRATSIQEFHVGRAARVSSRIDGEVKAELVSQMSDML